MCRWEFSLLIKERTFASVPPLHLLHSTDANVHYCRYLFVIGFELTSSEYVCVQKKYQRPTVWTPGAASAIIIIAVWNRATVTVFPHEILLSAETSIDSSLTCLKLIHNLNPLHKEAKPTTGRVSCWNEAIYFSLNVICNLTNTERRAITETRQLLSEIMGWILFSCV